MLWYAHMLGENTTPYPRLLVSHQPPVQAAQLHAKRFSTLSHGIQIQNKKKIPRLLCFAVYLCNACIDVPCLMA